MIQLDSLYIVFMKHLQLSMNHLNPQQTLSLCILTVILGFFKVCNVYFLHCLNVPITITTEMYQTYS